LEDVAAAFELFPQRRRIHQVAVVRQRHLPLLAAHHQGLRVLEIGVASGRVTRVPDGRVPLEGVYHFLRKHLGDVDHAFVANYLVSIGCSDSGALLPAMLESVEAKIGELGRLRVSLDGEDSTMVVELVVGQAMVREKMERRQHRAESPCSCAWLKSLELKAVL